MNIPCPTLPVTCPAGADADDPLISNASAETPDVRKFFAYQYALRSSSLCEANTQELADICALNPPDPDNSDVIFSSAAQTCTIDCSGSSFSYTLAAGAAIGFSQAAADAAAYSLACTLAAIVCSGGSGTTYPNEAQACSVTCQDGTVKTATVAAGSVLGLSQAEANASAYAIACQAAAMQCPENPPPSFGNVAVNSTSDCPSGGTFTYLVAANTFFATSQAEANATAQSYADQQAVLQRKCLSSIVSATCKNEPYGALIAVDSEPSSDFTWSIISGSLPPSFNFADGLITGGATVSGVYSFTVKAVHNVTGNYSARTYTIGVMEITSASPLTDGAIGSAYSVTLTQIGVPSTASWNMAFGTSLPAGLSLSSSGVISGTPSATGTTAFSVSLVDVTSGFNCTKDFEIEITLAPLDWWKMDEASTNPRIGSVNGISLGALNTSSVAGGKYGNATALNSFGGGFPTQAWVSNDGSPVTGLAYAGNGIDAFIWIDNPAGAINSDTIFLLTFTDSSGTPVWAMRFTIDNQVGIEYDMTGGASGNIPLATSTAYRFFELYYDPSVARLGLRINDGAVMDQNIAIGPVPPATAKGSISITYDRRTAGSSAANVCEMAVYPAILSAAQRAYLYQGGLGRTWPVVLP